MTTYTTHYSLPKPDVGASANTWGSDPGGLNEGMDLIDAALFDIETTADAALPKAGGQMTGDITFAASTDVGTTALPAAQVHASELLIHQPGGATLAAISTAGALTAVTVTQTSDAAYKKGLGFIDPEAALFTVETIPPNTFYVAADNFSRQHAGFIAQEVKNAAPVLVMETNNFLASENRYALALDHGGLIAYLWAAVQALSTRVKALEDAREPVKASKAPKGE